MRAPFFDFVQGVIGRRPADLELIERVERAARDDHAQHADDTAAPRTETALSLQRMENRLLRHHLHEPDVLSGDELRRLRYILNFARITDFEPGAAGPGGTRGRGDVSIGAELASWRSRVIDVLSGPLQRGGDDVTSLTETKAALAALTDGQDEQRRLLIERHGSDFSAAELDAEAGYKKLVTVLGGGGGAGFVYIGGMQRLLDAGHVPDYLIGSSIGAAMGAVVSRTVPVPLDEYLKWAKTVSYRAILGPEHRFRRHGLTGMFSLRFDRFADAMFRRADGEQMRIADLDIPYEAVLAGVRRQSFDLLPSKYRREKLTRMRLRTIPYLPIGIGPQLAMRLWQVAAFIDARVTKPIVVGGDDLTRDLNVVDAASFSSAIPGVLHHETSDPQMVPILDALLAEHGVSAIIDGGTASNVPIELAWKRVRDGKLGTRNACYLAFDCFHPQWDPRHLWLVPITQAVQLQMARNAPYADHLVRFAPTLSPVNLAPSAAAIDDACGWGRDSVGKAIPVVSALLAPTWWEGDRPPTPGEVPARAGSAVPSMSAVMAAIRSPKGRLARRRSRRSR